MDTPEAAFAVCQNCNHNFWSCGSCGRLYHLDKTSCQNAYCPDKGVFWTTRFGSDRFLQTPLESCLPKVPCDDETSPKPAWVGGATAGSDIRWPCLHSQGLILSVQDTGVVELWAERGAPQPALAEEFGEKSVCLTRLDLGEGSPCPPFVWNQQFFVPGQTALTTFEFSSSPSLGRRIPLDEVGPPKHFAPHGSKLLVWGAEGLALLSEDGFLEMLSSELVAQRGSLAVSGAEGVLLYQPGAPPQVTLVSPEGVLGKLNGKGLPGKLEYGLHADGFVLLGGNNLCYLDGESFTTVELPTLVVTEPIFDPVEKRLTLLLSDSSARACSPRGDKFSFLCDLQGTPSTPPLRLGDQLFYGIEGRYLCRGAEAIRPRLPSAPIGALSYANRRVFGTTREGSMFCFELE